MAERRIQIEPRVSWGNVASIVTTVVAASGVIYGMQGDSRVYAQRIAEVEKKIEKGEARDDETAKTLNDVKGAIIELRGDQKAIRAESERQGRQLDRIEQLLQQRSPLPAPPAAPRDPITVYPPR